MSEGGDSGSDENSDQVISALRVKVSKLERLCTLTRKKLEEFQKAAHEADKHAEEARAAAKAALESRGVTAEAVRQDIHRGRTPTVLARIVVEFCPVPEERKQRSAADSEFNTLDAPKADGASLLEHQAWCCVARRTAGQAADCERSEEIGWVREQELEGHLPQLETLPLCLLAKQGQKLSAKCDRLQRQLDALQARHLSFRVNHEAIVRSKDSQVAEANQKAAALQQRRISGEDVTTQLEAAKRQIQSLTRSYDELQALEASRRKSLKEANAKLRNAHQDRDLWKRRYEDSVRDTDTRRDSTAAGSAEAKGTDWAERDDDTTKQLAEVTAEYAVYRKRALEIITKKDMEIQQLQMAASARSGAVPATPPPAVGGDGSAAYGAGSEFGTADSGTTAARQSRDDATHEYLKNILLRYMLSTDDNLRSQLETAVGAVMGFSHVELQRVREARLEAAKATSLWSKATSLF